jgi:hypothetical protein
MDHAGHAVRQEVNFDDAALAPPPGEHSNFKQPSNQNVLCLIVASVALTITFVCILARAYSRLIVLKRIRVEDRKAPA